MRGGCKLVSDLGEPFFHQRLEPTGRMTSGRKATMKIMKPTAGQAGHTGQSHGTSAMKVVDVAQAVILHASLSAETRQFCGSQRPKIGDRWAARDSLGKLYGHNEWACLSMIL